MPDATEMTLSRGTALLQRRVRVALGEEPGDLLLRGGQIVNVFTGQIDKGDVVIADGWIAGVGPYAWQAQQTIELDGGTVIPGLIDAHMHLESTLLLPDEFARVAVPHGTSAVIADPHEIGNVAGIDGVRFLIESARGLPVDVFFMAPSCVPASSWESAGATLDAAAVAQLLDEPGVLGLAEMMNFPGVIAGDTEVLEKLAHAQAKRRPVDGHAPGLTGQALQAYAGTGVRSDHESTTIEEGLAKAALGMLVQVREGSEARNLDTFLPLLVQDRLGDWCLATDDISVNDLMAHGHLDARLRRVIAAGVPIVRAVRHATLVPARHYGLTDRGAVAPGYRADLVIVDDFADFRPRLVLKDGDIVARDGEYTAPAHPRPPMPSSVGGSVRLGSVSPQAFELTLKADECPAVRVLPEEIVTQRQTTRVNREPGSGRWRFDPSADVAVAACVERHRASGRVGLGLVCGFGLKRPGALGSTVAHDAHNLVLVGTDANNLYACARAIEEMGGGLAVVADGEVVASLRLDVAGLMSSDDHETVARGHDTVIEAARGFGCPLPAPFGTLSFLCLSVIPELRITDHGLLDVSAQRVMSV